MIPLPKLFFVAIEDFADLFVNRPHDWSNCASCVEILDGYRRRLRSGRPDAHLEFFREGALINPMGLAMEEMRDHT